MHAEQNQMRTIGLLKSYFNILTLVLTYIFYIAYCLLSLCLLLYSFFHLVYSIICRVWWWSVSFPDPWKAFFYFVSSSFFICLILSFLAVISFAGPQQALLCKCIQKQLSTSVIWNNWYEKFKGKHQRWSPIFSVGI